MNRFFNNQVIAGAPDVVAANIRSVLAIQCQVENNWAKRIRASLIHQLEQPDNQEGEFLLGGLATEDGVTLRLPLKSLHDGQNHYRILHADGEQAAPQKLIQPGATFPRFKRKPCGIEQPITFFGLPLEWTGIREGEPDIVSIDMVHISASNAFRSHEWESVLAELGYRIFSWITTEDTSVLIRRDKGGVQFGTAFSRQGTKDSRIAAVFLVHDRVSDDNLADVLIGNLVVNKQRTNYGTRSRVGSVRKLIYPLAKQIDVLTHGHPGVNGGLKRLYKQLFL